MFTESADIYDLLYSFKDYEKESDEISAIIKAKSPRGTTILDIGCGTGHHVGKFTEQGFNTLGLDISNAMITQAKSIYPNGNFQQGDALNSSIFSFNTFTHILCIYFTIYYFEDKNLFLQNC